MKKNIFILLSAIVFALLFSCKKTPGDDVKPEPDAPGVTTPIGIPNGIPVSKTIGNAGGSLSSADGKIELNIPAGALTVNTEITIQSVTNHCPGGIGAGYHLMPDNLTFSKPAELTFHYSEDDVNGTHPYFFYIAYQHSDNTWKADCKKRIVDTLGKTVRLSINHFSIWSMGENIQLESRLDDMQKNKFYENETADISAVLIVKSGVSEPASGPGEDELTALPQAKPFPDEIVSNWKVNGQPGGNSKDGVITGSGSKVKYTAPAEIKARRTVQISAEVQYSIMFFNNGKMVNKVNKLILFKNLTLLPSVYEYTVDIAFNDESPFGYSPGQVYSDKASFDLTLKKIEDLDGAPNVIVSVSNIKNYPPDVVPPSYTYQIGSGQWVSFDWIKDNIGETNVTDVILWGFRDDSVVSLRVIHQGAQTPGFAMKSSASNEIITQAPTPLGGDNGITSSIDMILARRDQNDKWTKIKVK